MRKLAASTICLVFIILFAPGFASMSRATAGDTKPSAVQMEAAEVVDLYGAEIMKLPGVWGVGDYADPYDRTITIRVMVDTIPPELESAIPPVLGGFPVVIDVGPRPRLAFGSGSRAKQPTPSRTKLDAEDQKAGQVVALFGPDIMKIPGVWGVQDWLKPDGHIEIMVDVEQITPEIQSEIPPTLGTSPSFPVEIFVGPPSVE